MKKFIWLTILSIFFFAPASVNSQENFDIPILKPKKISKVYVLSQDQVVNKDLFAYGEVVDIYGTVNGDVYAAGGEVNVAGNINGDLLAAGGNLNISGNISQDIRIAGGNISFSGKVGRNATVLGGNASLGADGKILGSLVSGTGDINLVSKVGKQIILGSGKADIFGDIGSDASIYSGKINIGNNARINGDLNYWSEEKASIDPGAEISGATSFHRTKTSSGLADRINAEKYAPRVKIMSQLFLFLIGFAVIFLFKNTYVRTQQNLSSKIWKSFGVGLFSIVISVGGFILLCLTILGIPLAILLSFFYIFLLYISRVFPIIKTGNYILKKIGDSASPVWSYVIGFLVYMVLLYIPFFRGFVPFLFSVIGFGSLFVKNETPLLIKSANKKTTVKKKKSLTRAK